MNKLKQKLEKRILDSIEGWIIYLQKEVNDPEDDNLYRAIQVVLKIPFDRIPIRLNDHVEGSAQYKINKHRLSNNLVEVDAHEFMFSRVSADVTYEGLLEEYNSSDSDDVGYIRLELNEARCILNEYDIITKGLVNKKLQEVITIWKNMLDRLCHDISVE